MIGSGRYKWYQSQVLDPNVRSVMSGPVGVFVHLTSQFHRTQRGRYVCMRGGDVCHILLDPI